MPDLVIPRGPRWDLSHNKGMYTLRLEVDGVSVAHCTLEAERLARHLIDELGPTAAKASGDDLWDTYARTVIDDRRC